MKVIPEKHPMEKIKDAAEERLRDRGGGLNGRAIKKNKNNASSLNQCCDIIYMAN